MNVLGEFLQRLGRICYERVSIYFREIKTNVLDEFFNMGIHFFKETELGERSGRNCHTLVSNLLRKSEMNVPDELVVHGYPLSSKEK